MARPFEHCALVVDALPQLPRLDGSPNPVIEGQKRASLVNSADSCQSVRTHSEQHPNKIDLNMFKQASTHRM